MTLTHTVTQAIITIPAGAPSGAVLTFDLDASTAKREDGGSAATDEAGAAVLIQARVRGTKARQLAAREKEQAEAVKVHDAAVRIQKIRRGQLAREELAREREEEEATSTSRCVIS